MCTPVGGGLLRRDFSLTTNVNKCGLGLGKSVLITVCEMDS